MIYFLIGFLFSLFTESFILHKTKQTVKQFIFSVLSLEPKEVTKYVSVNAAYIMLHLLIITSWPILIPYVIIKNLK